VKEKHINTPQDYKDMLEKAFPGGGAEVKDIFSVPDYKSFLLPMIDKFLAYYSKLEDTKLQWSFQKTRDPSFPLGVRVKYRAFARDTVILLVTKEAVPKGKRSLSAKDVGYQGVEASIDWQPRNEDGELTYITICDRPTVAIRPQGLVLGSRKVLNNVLAAANAHFHKSQRDLDLWRQWNATMPENDSVVEYLRSMPLHIPFCSIFSLTHEAVSAETIAPLGSRKRARPEGKEPLLKVISTASVQTSTHPRQPPFVWADTGLPVDTRVGDVVQDSDASLLEERDYTALSNDALKKLLVSLKGKYNINTRITATNKTQLIELVARAVPLARAAAASTALPAAATTTDDAAAMDIDDDADDDDQEGDM